MKGLEITLAGKWPAFLALEWKVRLAARLFGGIALALAAGIGLPSPGEQVNILGSMVFFLVLAIIHQSIVHKGPAWESIAMFCGLAADASLVTTTSWAYNLPAASLIAVPLFASFKKVEGVRASAAVLAFATFSAILCCLLFFPDRLVDSHLWSEWAFGSVVAVGVNSLSSRIARERCGVCQINAAHSGLIRKLVNAQEEERKRIARELHDSRSQDLTALIINLDMLRQSLPAEDADLRGRLDKAHAQAEAILADVRNLMVQLRPSVLDDLGLAAGVQWLTKQVSKTTGISAEAVVDKLEGERFPPQVETAMFRIVQEALTNVTKYAEASRVLVGLSQKNGRLRAVVEDNGKGFNIEDTWQATAGRSAFGLLGMYERATLLGGSLDIESRPGNGTRVTAEIPVDGGVSK